tara:strand:+ start:93 stop:512 length:420 start_codon:yes stop_codon:yes gene_type:complete
MNDTENLVMQTTRMRLTGKEAVSYLQARGTRISVKHYYKVKSKLDSEKLSRLHEIGSYGFVDQHLDRIENLELVQELLWKNYWKVHVVKPDIALRVLREIREVQPYLSAYYEATKHIIQKDNGQGSINLSSLGTTAERT